jgi:hypothetical protein
MLSRREANAFFLAASTAPVVACIAFGSSRQWLLAAAVAYVAAFTIGAPLFAYLRRRSWSLASRSLVAATVAGVLAALLVVTLVLVAFPPQEFLTNPRPVLFVVAFGVAWGLGLGVIAGLALSALLRSRAFFLSEA